jgi:Rho GDP-dissociation inhibitor
VDKTEETVGSFAPRSEPYEFTFEEETAPEGWLARGDYKAKTKVRAYFESCMADVN